MSHNAKIETVINDVPAFKQAIVNCGGEVLEEMREHKAYYGSPVPCEFGFRVADPSVRLTKSGQSHRQSESYGKIGVVRGTDGTYSLRYDAWGVNLLNLTGKENPGFIFGDKFGNWEERGGVHYPIADATPNKLLAEYSAVLAERYAKKKFMKAKRVTENGRCVKVILTGGELKGAESIEVILNEDGTSTMAAIGFKGKRCEKATAPLQAILGITVDDQRLGDYYHDEQGNHVARQTQK